MEQCELIEKIQALAVENETLKNRNLELTKKLGEQKNWIGIREGELLPRLRKRYGRISSCSSNLVNPIAQIVTSLLDVNKRSEINETNYDIAKKISVDLTCSCAKFSHPL